MYKFLKVPSQVFNSDHAFFGLHFSTIELSNFKIFPKNSVVNLAASRAISNTSANHTVQFLAYIS